MPNVTMLVVKGIPSALAVVLNVDAKTAVAKKPIIQPGRASAAACRGQQQKRGGR